MERVGELIEPAFALVDGTQASDLRRTEKLSQFSQSIVSKLPVSHSETEQVQCFEMGDVLSQVDLRALWSETLADLKQGMDAEIFSAWIRPLTLGKAEVECLACSERAESPDAKNSRGPHDGGESFHIVGARIQILCPNKFAKQYLHENFQSTFVEKFSALLGIEKVSVNFDVATTVRGPADIETRSQATKTMGQLGNSSTFPPPSPASRPQVKQQARVIASPARRERSNQVPEETNLNAQYNFSNFVVGDCNQFAHAVSLRVAENPGRNYNPLFIYGGVGLGKTHLANAIGNASFRRQKKVMLVSSEYFVSELISALRSSKMSQFKSRFRSLDVLIIDDIQFIIGKERTQEEFFHTFNELHQHGKQIIITSDKLPQELDGLEERLRTRFASGLAVDLQTPDFETRVAILIRKSEALGNAIDEEVARILAERITTNIRELEGALNRLMALSSLHKSRVTVNLAEEVLRTVAPQRMRDLNIESIQKLIAERYSVSHHDLLGKRRTQNIAFARQVGMFLTRKLIGCSFPEIGAFYGGRDHSTVIHACRVIEDRASGDARFKDEIDRIERELVG